VYQSSPFPLLPSLFFSVLFPSPLGPFSTLDTIVSANSAVATQQSHAFYFIQLSSYNLTLPTNNFYFYLSRASCVMTRPHTHTLFAEISSTAFTIQTRAQSVGAICPPARRGGHRIQSQFVFSSLLSLAFLLSLPVFLGIASVEPLSTLPLSPYLTLLFLITSRLLLWSGQQLYSRSI
jgi:hypothetical protein